MIQIKYCGACGDHIVVDKIEQELSEIEEIQKIECGRCQMQIKANGETIYNEQEDIMDITAIKENTKQVIKS